MRSSDRGVDIRRVYGDNARDVPGYRVLVDRLWPRGLSKRDAALDEWAKSVAPSTELRLWYGHEPARFDEFARRYGEELARPPGSEDFERLRRLGRTRRVILLTATRDVEHSGARVLRDHLMTR